jgi:hypothetical protein
MRVFLGAFARAMTETTQACVAAALIGLALTAQPANASFLGASADAFGLGFVRLGVVRDIHGCHYACACGPPRELACEQWNHRHLHMLCLPVRCERDANCEAARPEHMCRGANP